MSSVAAQLSRRHRFDRQPHARLHLYLPDPGSGLAGQDHHRNGAVGALADLAHRIKTDPFLAKPVVGDDHCRRPAVLGQALERPRNRDSDHHLIAPVPKHLPQLLFTQRPHSRKKE